MIDLVKNGKDVPNGWLGFDFTTSFPTEQAKGDFDHRLFVFAKADEQLAFGLLELFGELRFSCVLSERWDGPSLGKVYRLDPITGNHSEANCDIPKDITKAVLVNRTATNVQIGESINRIVGKALRKTEDELTNDLVESVLQKHIYRTDLSQTQKMSIICRELAEGFVHQIYRLPDESNIDIEKLVD